jgi:hypothetical protein
MRSSGCCALPQASPGPPTIRGPNGRITRVRYVLPRHKAATWVGPGHGRKSTPPGANGVIELTPSAGRMPVRRSSQTSALAATAQGGRGQGWPCRRNVSSTAWPISCRRRGSTGIATTGCLRRITSSGGPSRRWRSGGDWLVFRRNRCLSPAAGKGRETQGNRDRHRLLRSRSQSLARHLADCLGETPGPGGRGVSARVSSVRRRHPADRVHYRPRAHPCDGRRQESAPFEPEVRKRAMATMALPA